MRAFFTVLLLLLRGLSPATPYADSLHKSAAPAHVIAPSLADAGALPAAASVTIAAPLYAGAPACSCPFQDTSPQPDQTFCSSIRNTAFQAGEVLTYRVYYAVAGAYIAAGEGTFSTSLEKFEHKDVYHVVGDGKTYSFEDKFFRVRDRYESY